MSQITGTSTGLYGGQSIYGEGGWLEAMNSALKQLDAFINLSVMSATTGIKPTLANSNDDKGKKYLIPNNATGDWGSYKGFIAHWDGTNWTYYFPQRPDGLILYALDTKKTYIYDLSVQDSYKWITKATESDVFKVPTVGHYTGIGVQSFSSKSVLDILSPSSPTTKYLIQVKNESGLYQSSEILTLCYTTATDTEAVLTEYARVVKLDTPLCNFTVEAQVSNNVTTYKLYGTPVSGLVYVKILKYSIFE